MGNRQEPASSREANTTPPQRQRRCVPQPGVGRGTRPTLGHPAPSYPNRNAVVARHGSGDWSLATCLRLLIPFHSCRTRSREDREQGRICPSPLCVFASLRLCVSTDREREQNGLTRRTDPLRKGCFGAMNWRSSTPAPGEGTRPSDPWLGLNERDLSSLVAAKIAKKAAPSLSPTSAPPRLCAKTSPPHPPPDRKQSRAEAQRRRGTQSFPVHSPPRDRCGAPTEDSPRRQPWDALPNRKPAPDGATESLSFASSRLCFRCPSVKGAEEKTAKPQSRKGEEVCRKERKGSDTAPLPDPERVAAWRTLGNWELETGNSP